MQLKRWVLGTWVLTLASWASAAAPAATASINSQLRDAWKSQQITPAPTVDDARFLRRASLDIAGRLPEPARIEKFLADTDPDKRSKAVDELLASPDYAKHWADYWDMILMGRLTREGFISRDQFKGWLREQFEKNTPWDKFVRDLVAAEGWNTNRTPGNSQGDPPDLQERFNPATNWFLRYSMSIPELSGATAKVFLGVQIQCAQCHDHKTEKWTQKDFRQFTAFFSKTWPSYYDKGLTIGTARRDTRDHLYVPPVEKYERFFGSYKDYIKDTPKVLNGHEVTGMVSRRKELAEWMTAKENPWFAQAIVNRLWARFLGRGFVEPIDDFRPGNPPVLPEALDGLADDFVAGGYDLKHLISVICNSDAYQRACRSESTKPGEHSYWSSYPLKQLEPEELFDVVLGATESEPYLTRAMKNHLEVVRVSFIRQFVMQMGTDDMAEISNTEETIPRALMFLNGALVNGTTRMTTGIGLAKLLKSNTDDGDCIRKLYLRTLSREPSAKERATWQAYVKQSRPVAHTSGPTSDLPAGAKALAVSPEIANAPADADFNSLLQYAKTGADFRELRTRVKNNADGALYVKAFEAFAAEAPFQHLANQPGGATARDQNFENLYWALLNSTEFLTNH